MTIAKLVLLGTVALPRLVRALVIRTPDNTTIWDRSGTTRTFIRWALEPPTDPPPRTHMMSIWLRNGAPEMYDPPLNLTLARHVDFVAKQQVEVQDVVDFLPGTGYQLFLSDPDNATLVYCESPVFDIDDDPQAAYVRRLNSAASSGTSATPLSTSPSLAWTTSARADSTTSLSATTTARDTQDTRTSQEDLGTTGEMATASSTWITSVTSLFNFASEPPPPSAEDTSRVPVVIVRPSPPPVRSEDLPSSSSMSSQAALAGPASSEEVSRPELPITEPRPSSRTPSDTVITPAPPPPPANSPSPPDDRPVISSTLDKSSSSEGPSSTRDFYWYYSDPPLPASRDISSGSSSSLTRVEAAQAVATGVVEPNVPCTCREGGGGGGTANAYQNVNPAGSGGTGFQIIIRPIPGTQGDEGLRLFTSAATTTTKIETKSLSVVVAFVTSLVYFV